MGILDKAEALALFQNIEEEWDGRQLRNLDITADQCGALVEHTKCWLSHVPLCVIAQKEW